MMPSITGILETSLYVAEVARSSMYYRLLFDFRPMIEDERFCALDTGTQQVLLLFKHGQSNHPMATAGGIIPPHDGRGQTHLAFSCNRDELPKWEAKLAEQHVPIESRVEWDRGGVSIYFRDPDGHLIELATPGVWPIY